MRIRNEVDEATKKARTDKEIGLNELAADIYSEPKLNEEVRNILPNNHLRHSRLGKAVNLWINIIINKNIRNISAFLDNTNSKINSIHSIRHKHGSVNNFFLIYSKLLLNIVIKSMD